jgi:hypothetical protein
VSRISISGNDSVGCFHEVFQYIVTLGSWRMLPLLPRELRDSCLGSKPWSKEGVLNFLKHFNERKKFIPVSPALSGFCLDVSRFTNPWISTQLHLEESPRTQLGLPHSAHQLGTQSGCPTSPCDYSVLAAIALTSYCRNLTTKAAPIQQKYATTSSFSVTKIM